MTRYLGGLCVAALGMCGGGWLIVAAVAFGGPGGEAGRVNLATGAGLMLGACVTGVAWAVAWRRRMRMDGVLGDRFLLVSRRQARRNRRELARDIRRTARESKRVARRARRGADRPDQPDQPDQPAGDGCLDATRYLGIVVHEHGPDGRALHGREPGAAAFSTEPTGTGSAGTEPTGTEPTIAEPTGTELTSTGSTGTGSAGTELTGTELTGTESTGTGLNEFGHGGHDGASAADLLGELRTLRSLLGPLIAAAGPAPAPLAPPRRVPAPEARPELPRPPAVPPPGDDEVLGNANSEEAWW